MRRRLRLLLALALLAACDPVAAADAIGSVTKLQGEAKGTLDGNAVDLAAGTPIFMAEKLTTTGKARLELTFVDGTKLTIGDNASVTVDRFLYKPRGLGNAFNAAITGPFRFISGKLDKTPASLSQVETTFATIGVRGTDFWGGPIDGESGVFLIAGAVSVTNAGGSVDLTKPRQGTNIASPNAAPSAVTIWPKDKIARALATVNFRSGAAP
jgi:hypothetical protein